MGGLGDAWFHSPLNPTRRSTTPKSRAGLPISALLPGPVRLATSVALSQGLKALDAAKQARQSTATSKPSYIPANYSSSNYTAYTFPPFEAPKVPTQIPKSISAPPTIPLKDMLLDPNKYKLENATIEDLKKKYGFDFSREYANRIAEMERQAKQQGLEQQMQGIDAAQKEFHRQLDHEYFLKALEEQQKVADRGMNAGISSDANLRLTMNMQNDMASFLQKAEQERAALREQLAGLPLEQQQRAEQIFQERLMQAFEMLMRENEFRQRELQRQTEIDQFNKGILMDRYKYDNLSAADRENLRLAYEQLALEKQKFKTEQAWREYTYKNMSASERAQLDWMKQQFGEEMAWKIYELDRTQQLQMQLAAMQNAAGLASAGYSSSDIQNFFNQFLVGG